MTVGVEFIEQKILSRAYASPRRARFAVTRSVLGRGEKIRLKGLISAWEQDESNGHSQPVVGALPAGRDDDADGALEGEVVEMPRRSRSNGGSVEVNLNCRVTARLTLRGVAILHGSRDKVIVPDDLLARGGVWQTSLWEFMRVFGEHMVMGVSGSGDDLVVERCSITIEPGLP